eukprot:TRINITY_DN3398_c0_g1_i2.p1 TRINITY_DN3398_c0_g1~~TRINITY_DN3398_c0_g1_i2.p1  ORF type:complete len:344 (-),score=94.21 TRINITY_DN3398_c0_g1_i2:304-1335(-)
MCIRDSSARAFVNWYNGHPDFKDLSPDLSCEEVAIVGNGNVAVDIARLLVRDPAELQTTDIARHALEALSQSNVRRVHILGRRGPAQAAFANKELRELTGFPCVTRAAEMVLSEVDDEEAKQRAVKRKLGILAKVPEHTADEERYQGGGKQVSLRFLRSPHSVRAAEDGLSVGGLDLDVIELAGEAGKQKAVGTGEMETLGNVGMVIGSIGYQAEALPGMQPRRAWKHQNGRLEGHTGLYLTGWLKRGPSGIIGTNIPDAKQTSETVLADIAAGVLPGDTGDSPNEAVRELMPGHAVVSWEGWRAIEAHETGQGELYGKLSSPAREKLVDVSEMMQIVEQQRD